MDRADSVADARVESATGSLSVTTGSADPWWTWRACCCRVAASDLADGHGAVVLATGDVRDAGFRVGLRRERRIDG